MDETTLNMLIALVDACEGRLELHTRGIARATSVEDYVVWLEMEDGRRLTPEEVGVRNIEDAIYDWRQQHPAFFQRIIGSMM